MSFFSTKLSHSNWAREVLKSHTFVKYSDNQMKFGSCVYMNSTCMSKVSFKRKQRDFLPQAVNCGRFCFWRRQSVFFVCVWNISDVHQIHSKDVFGPSLGRVGMSRSKAKVIRGKKRHFSALLAAYVRFMFGKTCLASSLAARLA